MAIAEPDLSNRPLQLTAERTMAATPSVLFRAWTEQIRPLVRGAGNCADAGPGRHPVLFRDPLRGQPASPLRPLPPARTGPAHRTDLAHCCDSRRRNGGHRRADTRERRHSLTTPPRRLQI